MMQDQLNISYLAKTRHGVYRMHGIRLVDDGQVVSLDGTAIIARQFNETRPATRLMRRLIDYKGMTSEGTLYDTYIVFKFCYLGCDCALYFDHITYRQQKKIIEILRSA